MARVSWRRRSRGCLFTFHRAAASDVWANLPNRKFYLDLDFLDRFLTYLKQKQWAVVTIDEAIRRASLNKAGDRYVNFSVDDCYRDTFEAVVPVFRRHGVPLTLYVTTGIPDGTAALWYTGLEDVIATRERVKVGSQTIETQSILAKRKAFRQVSSAWDGPCADEHYAAFCRSNDVDPKAIRESHAISWDMLDTLRNDDLVEIGAHTMSHARISSLTRSAALAEIAGSGERLRRRLGVPVRHFAFPYGRRSDCGPRDFDFVREAGFASAATTRKGLIQTSSAPFVLPRNTLNGSHQNIAIMEAHLSGLSGLAAKWLHID
ncbi:MAG: polysaccharide deacetylase family protein [Beijerinckiaceae bacterium]|nr:polysaccharide deacetylase family protein [Beijerinckiaceae bacterium]